MPFCGKRISCPLLQHPLHIDQKRYANLASQYCLRKRKNEPGEGTEDKIRGHEIQ